MQMAAIAAKTPAELLDEWQQLNVAIARMEADGVRRRHPDYSEREVFLALARHRYGDELFQAAWPTEPLLAPCARTTMSSKHKRESRRATPFRLSGEHMLRDRSDASYAE
jgi:hypothetical protein